MKKSFSSLRTSILGIVFYAAVLVVNTLASALRIGGLNTGEISDLYPNLFVPAGITFSIWGIIYLLVGIYVIYSLVRSKSGKDAAPFIEKIGILFIVTCIANIGWIIVWQYRLISLSLVFMLLLLVSLIGIYVKLEIGKSGTDQKEKYLVHLPFSVYLGWISIATIANVTAILVEYKWNGFGIDERIWTILMMGIGILLGLLFIFLNHDIFYSLVIEWALIGIMIKRIEQSGTINAPEIIGVSIGGMILLTAAAIVQLFRKRVYT